MKYLHLTIVNLACFYVEIHLARFLEGNYDSFLKELLILI